MSQWIKCSEQMPDVGVEVIISCNGEVMGGMALSRDGAFYEVVEEYWSPPNEPSHWQPLPPPPHD